jgi:hypothetical protein
MALVRVLVDGYNLINELCRQAEFRDYQKSSLLHNWPELAPGQPRHSARARDELVYVLTRYQDATGERITIFFGGSGTDILPVPYGRDARSTTTGVEVLFSRAGQTADEMIERAAHRYQPYGEVLVVTDDRAERDTVTGLGGLTASCPNFIRMIEDALTELQDEVRNHNWAERNRFKRPHKNKTHE